MNDGLNSDALRSFIQKQGFKYQTAPREILDAANKEEDVSTITPEIQKAMDAFYAEIHPFYQKSSITGWNLPSIDENMD